MQARTEPVPNCVSDILRLRAEFSADVLAIAAVNSTVGSTEMTYGAWWQKATKIASVIGSQGWSSGQRCALAFTAGRWPELAAAYFGAVIAGVVPVLLTPGELREYSYTYLANDLGVVGVLADENTSGHPLETITYRNALESEVPELVDFPGPFCGQDALDIVLTSGTTGRPKALQSTHENWAPKKPLTSLVRRNTCVVAGIPMRTSTALHGMIIGSLERGVSTVFVDEPTVASLVRTFARAINSHDAREASTTPLVICPLADENLLEEVKGDLQNLRYLKVFAGPIPPRVGRVLGQVLPKTKVISVYGLTEGGRAVLTAIYDSKKPHSIGRPVGETQISVRHSGDGSACDPNCVGDIFVRVAGEAPLLSISGDSEVKGRVLDGWVRTGDIGYRDELGSVYLMGRENDIVPTSGGGRLKAYELEAQILAVPGVSEA